MTFQILSYDFYWFFSIFWNWFNYTLFYNWIFNFNRFCCEDSLSNRIFL